MLHGAIVVAHQLLDELEVLVLVDQEDVVPDELIDQVLPQLGRDLQGVHAQGQKHLDHGVDVLLLEVLDQLRLVLVHHGLGYQLAACNITNWLRAYLLASPRL